MALYALYIEREHAGENIAIASPMLRRSVREHRRCITQIIRDIITSIDIADVYTIMLRTSPMCRRCVWDILYLGVSRRMLGAVLRYITDGSWRRNIGRKFQCMHLSRCPDVVLANMAITCVADHSANYWRMVPLP